MLLRYTRTAVKEVSRVAGHGVEGRLQLVSPTARSRRLPAQDGKQGSKSRSTHSFPIPGRETRSVHGQHWLPAWSGLMFRQTLNDHAGTGRSALGRPVRPRSYRCRRCAELRRAGGGLRAAGRRLPRARRDAANRRLVASGNDQDRCSQCASQECASVRGARPPSMSPSPPSAKRGRGQQLTGPWLHPKS